MKPLAMLKMIKNELRRYATLDESDDFGPAYEGLNELIDQYEIAEATDAHCVIGDATDLHGPEGASPMICFATGNVRALIREQGLKGLSECCPEQQIVDRLKDELPRAVELAKGIELETAQLLVELYGLDWLAAEGMGTVQ